jgi:hypothetical protein
MLVVLAHEEPHPVAVPENVALDKLTVATISCLYFSLTLVSITYRHLTARPSLMNNLDKQHHRQTNITCYFDITPPMFSALNWHKLPT